VLGSAAIVAVIGLAAVTAARVQRRSVEGTADLGEARLYAQSAVDMGLYLISSNANWRSAYPSGVWQQDVSLGAGKYTLEGVDPADGDLADSPTDPLVLTATGVKGAARHKTAVTLLADPQGYTCLETALHAGLNLVFNGATVTGNQTISSNALVTASLATINANVEAVGTITGGQYNGTNTPGVAPRTMPAADAFDYYLSNGTAISFAGIPKSQGTTTIEHVVFSPARNPYGGTTNAEGIYVINCASQTLRIREVRIVGTLVLLEPGGGSVIEQSVNWEAAVANYPALMVRGSVDIQITDNPLSESSGNVSYNPAGTPYQGDEDDDFADTYPSLITGLVYLSGSCNTNNAVTVDGAMVVGGVLTATGTLNLTYRTTFLDDPPPGFLAAIAMRVSHGTWKQVVN